MGYRRFIIRKSMRFEVAHTAISQFCGNRGTQGRLVANFRCFMSNVNLSRCSRT